MLEERSFLFAIGLALAAASYAVALAASDASKPIGQPNQPTPVEPSSEPAEHSLPADGNSGPICRPGGSPTPTTPPDVSGTFVITYRQIVCCCRPCPRPALLEGTPERFLGALRFSCDTPDHIAASSNRRAGRVKFTGDLWIDARGGSVLRASSAGVALAEE